MLAQQLGEAHGWSRSTIRCAMDGLTDLLAERPLDEPVLLSQVRAETARHAPTLRIAEVLADLDLLVDDTTATIRSWIETRTSQLPAGFAADVRAWLLVFLDGDARTRPRSPSSLYVYFGSVRPHLERWAVTRDHLREVTPTDVQIALDPLRGWQRRNATAALRSLFRFAKKRGLIFANPTARLKYAAVEPQLVPMTEAEINAVEQLATTPLRRLIVALSAVHAARPAAIRHLALDDLDLPNRRITLAGHDQRLGELPYLALHAWLRERHATWPKTPNRHVLISQRTAIGTAAVSDVFLKSHSTRLGIDLERIRGDRVLHEALTVGPDPLHLALVFNLSHTTASRYVSIAQTILDTQIEEATPKAPLPSSNPPRSQASPRE